MKIAFVLAAAFLTAKSARAYTARVLNWQDGHTCRVEAGQVVVKVN